MATDHADATDRDRCLDELATAYLKAVEAGEVPDRQEWLARHPDLAKDLASFFADQDALDALALPLRAAAAPRPFPSNGDPPPVALGDYRILREVGRGGMGVVYEAEQLSLRRRVALKVLPFASALDPRRLSRFRVEAQAAAGLHHSNIVPVHAVGCERGVHYYAMQFIEGGTLVALVRELRRLEGRPADGAEGCGPAFDLARSLTASRPGPSGPSVPPPKAAEAPTPPPGPAIRDRSYFRMVARLGLQAAEALNHAHEQGVIHRDIKPANLLVDARGHLWVADFGLARLGEETGPTATGDLLGTYRYMSPEQAAGKRVVDHRTDIYSLGVTLYELLTLEPAFDGRDAKELLRQVASEEPRPPRRIDRAIPRELETIVLKAMAKEPESRYATAQECADDLQRFLEHKPIHARRPTIRERAAKWARRNTAVVVSTLAMLVLAVIALATSTVLIARKEAEVERQRDRARERLALARAAVDDMYTQVATKWLAQQPRLDPAQRDFLLKALSAYERFAKEGGDSPDLLRELGRSSQRAGEIRLKLGEFSRAESDLRRALTIQRDLVRRFPSTPEYRRDLSMTSVSLALLLQTSGRPRESIAVYREAVDLLTRLAGELPRDGAIQRSLVRACLDLSRVLSIEGGVDEAERLERRSLVISRALVRDYPDEAENRLLLAHSLDFLVLLRYDFGLDLHECVIPRSKLLALPGLASGCLEALAFECPTDARRKSANRKSLCDITE